MRIEQIALAMDGDGIEIAFRENGVRVGLWLPLPVDWDTMDRAAKIAYAKGEVAAHLLTHTYRPAMVPEFPDRAVADAAKDGFESLPGWATWTPAEAEAWIRANVNDLDRARDALGKLAAAVMYLRDIVIER